MVSEIVTLNLRMRLPRWWRLYLGTLLVLYRCGVPVDPEKAAARLVKHTEFEVT